MSAKHQVTEDLVTLRNDATKVMQDISKLTRQLRAVGVDRADEVGTELKANMQEEIRALRSQLTEINSKMKEYAERLNEHVKANPYPYIAGGIGVGYILGKFLMPRHH